MGKKHTDALVAKTQEIPALATKTFVTVAQYPSPNETVRVDAPYIVWHPAIGTHTQDRMTGPRSGKHPRFTGHIVGETADQVQVLADLLEQKLAPGGRGITMTVAGENSRALWFDSPLPIQVQTDPQPTVIYLVVEVGWSSEPAQS